MKYIELDTRSSKYQSWTFFIETITHLLNRIIWSSYTSFGSNEMTCERKNKPCFFCRSWRTRGDSGGAKTDTSAYWRAPTSVKSKISSLPRGRASMTSRKRGTRRDTTSSCWTAPVTQTPCERTGPSAGDTRRSRVPRRSSHPQKLHSNDGGRKLENIKSIFYSLTICIRTPYNYI